MLGELDVVCDVAPLLGTGPGETGVVVLVVSKAVTVGPTDEVLDILLDVAEPDGASFCDDSTANASENEACGAVSVDEEAATVVAGDDKISASGEVLVSKDGVVMVVKSVAESSLEEEGGDVDAHSLQDKFEVKGADEPVEIGIGRASEEKNVACDEVESADTKPEDEMTVEVAAWVAEVVEGNADELFVDVRDVDVTDISEVLDRSVGEV
ncbi:hypothetical protein EV421DRAFT_1735173 [Armillaria borealis]|uniref:Uncharacterized protein n=1 Tax=Armillaria borealis TaxID=47425 RepID=A0AA39MSN2_9AGAR|nr:hypothetical protein EV421DRAFT_1735173 [Armillaria borealis]